MEPTSSWSDSLPVQERCAIRRPADVLDYLGQHRKKKKASSPHTDVPCTNNLLLLGHPHFKAARGPLPGWLEKELALIQERTPRSGDEHFYDRETGKRVEKQLHGASKLKTDGSPRGRGR